MYIFILYINTRSLYVSITICRRYVKYLWNSKYLLDNYTMEQNTDLVLPSFL